MAATDDELLKLYTSVPEARSYPAPQPLDQFEQDLLRQYTAVPPLPAAVAQVERGRAWDNSSADDTLSGLAKGTATAIVKGLGDIPGTFGNVADFANYAAMRGVNAITGRPMEELQAESAKGKADAKKFYGAVLPPWMMPPGLHNGSDFSQPLLNKTGEYSPESSAGRIGMAGLEGAVAAMGGNPFNAAGGMVRNALVSGAHSALGQGVADATGDPLLAAGATLAPAAVARAGSATVNRLVGTVSPERAQLAATARDQYGIPLNAGQISESPATRFLEDVTRKMPFSGAAPQREAQTAAFNRSVSNTFGEDAPHVTPDVMARARDRIGAQFDAVANQTRVVPDQPLAQDFAAVLHDTRLGPAGVEQRVRANIQEIADRIHRNNGEVPYQDLTRVGDPASGRGAGIIQRLINDQDPHVREAGRGLRDALNDSLMRQAAPDQVQALQEARGQWRNLRTVEDLVAKSPDGNLSPALLQGRVNAKNRGTHGRAYGGGGQLGELADIGQAFLKTPPSSGTAERLYAQNALANIPSMVAAGVTGDMRALALPAIVDAGRIATGRVAGSILRSPTVTNSLIARSLGQQQAPGLANRLMTGALPYFASVGANNALVRPVLPP